MPLPNSCCSTSKAQRKVQLAALRSQLERKAG
jgi:hypothetical protein